MRLLLAAVGRFRPGPERDLFLKYAERLRPKLELIEVEEKRPLPVAERRTREAALLLDTIPGGAKLVALDERGGTLGSEQFARTLETWRDQAVPATVFLIGGADGHGPGVRERADLLLSFGAMTWPHMLVRTLLAEQLWRAQSLLSGHPYHRA